MNYVSIQSLGITLYGCCAFMFWSGMILSLTDDSRIFLSFLCIFFHPQGIFLGSCVRLDAHSRWRSSWEEECKQMMMMTVIVLRIAFVWWEDGWLFPDILEMFWEEKEKKSLSLFSPSTFPPNFFFFFDMQYHEVNAWKLRLFDTL